HMWSDIGEDPFAALGTTENLPLTFIYEVTDGIDTDTAEATITVNGVNDAPAMTEILFNGNLTEDVLEFGAIQGGGSFSVFDPDHAANEITTDYAFVSAAGHGGASLSADLMTALSANTGYPPAVFFSYISGPYQIDWSFVLDNNLVQYLGEGQWIEVTYSVNAIDSQGAFTAENVTVTIN